MIAIYDIKKLESRKTKEVSDLTIQKIKTKTLLAKHDEKFGNEFDFSRTKTIAKQKIIFKYISGDDGNKRTWLPQGKTYLNYQNTITK